jgi:hypothetical protein
MPQIGQQPGLGKLPGRMTSQNVMQLLSLEQGQQRLEQRAQEHAEDIALKRELSGVQSVQERDRLIQQSYKAHKPELEAMEAAGEAGKARESTYKQIKLYNASGKLIQGKKRQILEKMGLEDWFTNAPTQVANKMFKQLAQQTGKDFGTSRPTDFLVGLEADSQGSLINTQEGLDAIADVQILGTKAAQVRQKIKQELESKYVKRKEPYPPNITARINAKAEPLIKKYREKAIKNIETILKKQLAYEFDTVGKQPENTIIELDAMPNYQWVQKGGDWSLVHETEVE